MTPQEITGIVGALGFPIALVGGMLWFFATRVWPWYTKRTEDNDSARAKREESYAAQIAALTASFPVAVDEALFEKLEPAAVRPPPLPGER